MGKCYLPSSINSCNDFAQMKKCYQRKKWPQKAKPIDKQITLIEFSCTNIELWLHLGDNDIWAMMTFEDDGIWAMMTFERRYHLGDDDIWAMMAYGRWWHLGDDNIWAMMTFGWWCQIGWWCHLGDDAIWAITFGRWWHWSDGDI